MASLSCEGPHWTFHMDPYFYFKENFGLYIDPDTFNKFSAPITNLILSKQSQVIEIQKLIPWVILVLFVVGLTSLIVGLARIPA